jgi:sulfopyruvate decarboxylase TPP-binding subunit
VPRVDRYRLTLFDSTGSVVWETQTADTSAVPPHDIALYRGRYFWKVEAQTGWGRWVASELAEFSLGAPQP